MAAGTDDRVDAPLRKTFEARLLELEAYVDEHGRLPRATQRGLGKWLTNLRYRTSARKRQALDERVPGWDATRPRSRRKGLVTKAFLSRVSELEAYVAEHGDIPTRSPSSALRYWVEHKRKSASTDQRAVLDARVPAWAATKHIVVPFDRRLGDERSNIGEHGRIPKQQDGTLGDWVRYQRAHTPAEQPHPLDELAPSWREYASPKSVVEDRIAELQTLLASTGTYPRFSDGTIGRWLADQRRRATPENAAKLDAAFPGWRESGRPAKR